MWRHRPAIDVTDPDRKSCRCMGTLKMREGRLGVRVTAAAFDSLSTHTVIHSLVLFLCWLSLRLPFASLSYSFLVSNAESSCPSTVTSLPRKKASLLSGLRTLLMLYASELPPRNNTLRSTYKFTNCTIVSNVLEIFTFG